jgi:hypothetical protein
MQLICLRIDVVSLRVPTLTYSGNGGAYSYLHTWGSDYKPTVRTLEGLSRLGCLGCTIEAEVVQRLL